MQDCTYLTNLITFVYVTWRFDFHKDHHFYIVETFDLWLQFFELTPRVRRDDEVNIGETKILEINDEGNVLFGDTSHGFNDLASVMFEKHCDGNHSTPFFNLN